MPKEKSERGKPPSKQTGIDRNAQELKGKATRGQDARVAITRRGRHQETNQEEYDRDRAEEKDSRDKADES